MASSGSGWEEDPPRGGVEDSGGDVGGVVLLGAEVV